MSTQSEQVLEANLVQQLTTLGYARVTITNEAELLANLKAQLEKHNNCPLTANEFKKVLNHLDKGNVFEKAATLRDKFQLTKDNGQQVWLEFLNQEHWCQNQYQVTQQVKMEGAYHNRYDVTLLINGLPLVQIELKRKGLELKEAFNQVNRYQRHSYGAGAGLFQYVQLFVISNGVNTKYYANNRKQSFKQTFYWTDAANKRLSALEDFTQVFLEKCHVSKIIAKYIVLHQSDKLLMVLRPYQYFAVEAMIDKVKTSTQGGYIWHTTGSGKTLTSFKAAQILTKFPTISKVVFVVDRADLDYQTTREFNAYSEGCVDGTANTATLVKQFGNDTRLIVTTIQKLNTAISKDKYLKAMERLQDEKIVFIFDECHRSQFGDTHQRIIKFFRNYQLFGFTGTPIFKENALKYKTTKSLFGECLHKYLIPDAVKDENVLKFSVEYWGKLKRKDGTLIDDAEVGGINTKEFLESPARVGQIVDWVIENHGRKTHSKDFTAIMCVAGVDVLQTYYEAFKTSKQAGKHNLRVVTIFTYGVNEDDKDANGLIGEPDFELLGSGKVNEHSRDKLESYVRDYNEMFTTKHHIKDSQGFYNYYKDIAKRVKEREREDFNDNDRVDILLVVNMYLTGFDAKKVNTLYVDKNLKQHGLIQAFSRTNRILNEVKSQGNIVCFRNLKKLTDDAITLFSNPDAKEIILMEPYEAYIDKFNTELKNLFKLAPEVASVDELETEIEKLQFIKCFRNLMRLKNVLNSFSEFKFEDLKIEPQQFEDYKSKYLDLYDISRSEPAEEKVSILNDVDFELELIQRDEINVAYIVKLLAELHARQDKTPAQRADTESKRKAIFDILRNEPKLRSKRELLEEFINQALPKMGPTTSVESQFQTYWTDKRTLALTELTQTEGLVLEQVQEIISQYHFNNRPPMRDAILECMVERPRMLERKKAIDRVTQKIMRFIDTFEDDAGV